MIIWRQSLAHFNLRCHLSFLFALMDHHSTLWSSAVIFLGRGKLKTSRSLLKLCHFSAFQWLVTTGSPLILGNYVLSCPVSLTGSLITSLESRKELLSYHPSQHICTSHCANQTVLTCSHHWLLCDQKALSRTVWKSDRTVATTETDSEVFRVVFVLRNRFKQQQLQWHLAAGDSLHRLGAKHAILGGRSTSLVEKCELTNVLPQEKRTAKPEIPKTSVKVVLVGSKYCYMHHCISCCIWICRLCCSSSKNDFLVDLLSHVFFETWKSGQERLPAANGNVQGCHVIGKGWYNVIQPPKSVSTIIKEKNSSLYEHISPNVGTTSRPDCSHHVARQAVAAGGSFIAHMTTRGCHGING